MGRNRSARRGAAAGIGAALLALATAAGAAASGDDRGTTASHYYDGARQVHISLQPDLVADFSRAPAGSHALAVGASPLAGVGDSLVRFYRVPASGAPPGSAMATGATGAASPAAPAGSPVYREGDSPIGRLMALPGGVLVKFQPGWTRQQIDSWLAAYQVTVERPLAIGGNWFLLHTEPGAASLEAANAIYESGQVLSASPNWWLQTTAK